MATEGRDGGWGTVLLSAIVGAAVGAGVALLMAPKAGSELRNELGERAKALGEKLKEAAEKAIQGASELAAKAKAGVEHVEQAGSETKASPEETSEPSPA